MKSGWNDSYPEHPYRGHDNRERDYCSHSLHDKCIDCDEYRGYEQKTNHNIHRHQPHVGVGVIDSGEQFMLSVQKIEAVEVRARCERQSEQRRGEADRRSRSAFKVRCYRSSHPLEVPDVSGRGADGDE